MEKLVENFNVQRKEKKKKDYILYISVFNVSFKIEKIHIQRLT